MDQEEIKRAAVNAIGALSDRVMLTGGCAVDALLDDNKRLLATHIAEQITWGRSKR